MAASRSIDRAGALRPLGTGAGRLAETLQVLVGRSGARRGCRRADGGSRHALSQRCAHVVPATGVGRGCWGALRSSRARAQSGAQQPAARPSSWLGTPFWPAGGQGPAARSDCPGRHHADQWPWLGGRNDSGWGRLSWVAGSGHIHGQGRPAWPRGGSRCGPLDGRTRAVFGSDGRRGRGCRSSGGGGRPSVGIDAVPGHCGARHSPGACLRCHWRERGVRHDSSVLAGRGARHCQGTGRT